MAESIKDRIIRSFVEKGTIEEKKLNDIIGVHQEDIIRKLYESSIVDDVELLQILSVELGFPPIDISRVKMTTGIMEQVPEKLVEKYGIIPISRVKNNITLAVTDPTDIMAVDDVKTITGCNVEIVLATSKSIQQAIRTYYGGAEEGLSDIIEDVDGGPEGVEVVERQDSYDIEGVLKQSGSAPIVKLVSLIISKAIKERASDIHIEPMEHSVKVRYRIDGELHQIFDIPKKNQNAVLARLKIMSNMDITENRIPQDGRFRVKLEGKEIDFRVSVLPLNHGNKVVMRALDKGNLSIGLDKLGFLPGPLADFKKAVEHPYGIILVTGPTGSGKSTTLYSVLNELNVPERNIVTIEDPVEYQVAGLTQIAANSEIGLDFASGLRAVLRQSPDVIMVGEIRDFETADIAIKASLTGQMVLSTLHTNDAIGAVTRLANMGVEPFLIASSLVLTCAQRLLRRICPNCKAETEVSPEVYDKLAETYPEVRETRTFYKGKGCAKCNNTGYRGRLGTLETVLMDEQIKEMVGSGRPESEIRAYLKERGMKTLRDNAITKFCKGWTTLEEVFRVT